MSLDLSLRAKRASADADARVAFEDDGYYWFLHPLFERLRDESGKYLDLYGGATFTRDDFPRLHRLLDEAQAMAARQPATWKVHVGTQLHPVPKELYQLIHRVKLVQLIESFRRLVDAAEASGAEIEALGD